jgi:quercetin dioxygenase-like cupin family protein
MKVWDMTTVEVRAGQPEVLETRPEGRAIAIRLQSGGALGEHEVHEVAWLVVSSGRIRVADSSGGGQELPAGGLAAFDPAERHEITALEDSMLLLLLTPWPALDRLPPGRR